MRMREGHTVWEVDTLPGCSQVAVSHSMFIGPKDRGQGFSKTEGQLRLQRMQDLGWDYVLCTVDLSNERQIKQLIGNGWKQLDMFTSAKTGHTVALFGRLLGLEYFNRADYGLRDEFNPKM